MLQITRGFRSTVLASALAFVSLAACAETVHLKADLNAASEVPPTTSQGTGTLTATLDTDTHQLTYHVEFQNLTGPATAAHFHGPADPGAKAGPQVAVTVKPIVSPIEGKATLTEAQQKDLLDGKWYFNIHTAANGGGEIRGQVMKSE